CAARRRSSTRSSSGRGRPCLMLDQARLRPVSAGRIRVTAATEACTCAKPPRPQILADDRSRQARTMSNHRVAIIAGARTPFVKAGKAFASLGPSALAKHAVRGLLERDNVDPKGIDAIAFGAVVPERGRPNLAREIVFEAGLPASIEAQTVSSYCITGLRTATIIADAIARGRISAGIAGGVEWLSGADPATFREPTTGLSMGEHMEITRKQWEIPRSRQDEIAQREGRRPLAFIEAMDYAALHPDEGLLMAPAITVPRLLARAGLKLADIDLLEIHEAFAAQVLANAAAWERGWKGPATGRI